MRRKKERTRKKRRKEKCMIDKIGTSTYTSARNGIFIIFGLSLVLSHTISALPFSHILQLEVRASHSVDNLLFDFICFFFFCICLFGQLNSKMANIEPTHTNGRQEYLYFSVACECRRVLALASGYACNCVIHIYLHRNDGH